MYKTERLSRGPSHRIKDSTTDKIDNRKDLKCVFLLLNRFFISESIVGSKGFEFVKRGHENRIGKIKRFLFVF